MHVPGTMDLWVAAQSSSRQEQVASSPGLSPLASRADPARFFRMGKPKPSHKAKALGDPTHELDAEQIRQANILFAAMARGEGLSKTQLKNGLGLINDPTGKEWAPLAEQLKRAMKVKQLKITVFKSFYDLIDASTHEQPLPPTSPSTLLTPSC